MRSEAVLNSERGFLSRGENKQKVGDGDTGPKTWSKMWKVGRWVKRRLGGVRLSEHGIQNETINYQFLFEVRMFHLSRWMLLRRI